MGDILYSINTSSIMRYFPSLGITDIIEILILTVIFYSAIKSLKGTRAWVLSKGIMTLLMFYIVSYLLNFNVIVSIFQSTLIFIGVAIVVTIQPELRRMIERLGRKDISLSLQSIIHTIFKSNNKVDNQEKLLSDTVIQEIVKGCFIMGKAKTGVLIVIEREIPLNEYIESGIIVDGTITSALLINVFEHNTPLHDGAVIVRNNRLTAATCYLPLSDNMEINKDLGTRHRAGIGITEVTDAVVVIVSEETGAVSVAKDGKLLHNIDREQLSEELKAIQIKAVDPKKNKVQRKNKSELNISLKIGSLVAAFVMWVMVITALNPVTTYTFRNVPIEFINTDKVIDIGKTFEIQNDDTVDIKVKDRKSIVDNIKPGDIKVIADFSKLSYVNAIPLEYQFNGTSDITLSESTLKVSLEDIITTEVNVEIQKIGQPNELYYISGIELSNDTIVISGAKSVINTIGSVIIEIDESKLTHDTTIKAIPKIYDKNGEEINKIKLMLNREEIEVKVHLYKTKKVPLHLTPIVENETLGKIITNITYDTNEIIITGPDDVLDSCEALELAIPISIDLADISQTEYIKNIQLQNYITSDIIIPTQYNKVNMTIYFVDFYTKALELTSGDISVEGLEEDKEAFIRYDTANIDIVGLSKSLESKTISEIKPYINVSELPIGEHEVTIQFKDLTIYTYNPIVARVTIQEVNKE